MTTEKDQWIQETWCAKKYDRLYGNFLTMLSMQTLRAQQSR